MPNHNIDIAKIDSSIQLLKRHVNEAEIEPLISILEALKQDPKNELLFSQFSDAFNNLGITQGAVLTYAPYIGIILSDDPFGDRWR